MFLKRELRRTIIKFSTAIDLPGLLSRSILWRTIAEKRSSELEIVKLHLPIHGLPAAFAGLRLVQLSDIHIGTWVNLERLNQAVQMALALKPDIILLTGDYLPGYGWSPIREQQLADLEVGLRPLAGAAPTFSILGNHDRKTNANAILKALAGLGITDLTNKVYPLERGADRLYLAGVDDILSGYPRLDLVLKQLPADGPAILLAHEPDYADTSAATGRFALQISGHTHGGQVVLPYIGPPLLPRKGRKYPSGLYKVKGMYQYTNRGIGTGHQYVRFNCRPEITQFTLEQES